MNIGLGHLVPEHGAKPEKQGAHGADPPGFQDLGTKSQGGKKRSDKTPVWKQPVPAFLWGIMTTGVAVGGSAPAIIQAHGYAAQARAQQQSANAATAGAIHNGTETPDGTSVVMKNGSTVPIPVVNNTTKHYHKRSVGVRSSAPSRGGFHSCRTFEDSQQVDEKPQKPLETLAQWLEMEMCGYDARSTRDGLVTDSSL